MDLTPIRVRGARHGIKRLSPFVRKPPSERRRRDNSALGKGTKLALPSNDALGVPKRTLSKIEKLPLEILEAIFTFAPNPSFPLASPIFGGALSNDRMYSICASTWLLDAGPDDGPPSTNTALLNQVHRLLGCRWMTWTRFKDILGKIVVTSATLGPLQDDRIVPLNFTEPWRQPPLINIRLGPEVHIPEKLLCGPWSLDKSQFLYYLCFLGLRIDWNRSTAGEVASAGLEDAIKARSRLAVASLLSDQVLVLPTQEILRSAIMQYGCDETIVFLLLNACILAKSREYDGLVESGTLTANPLDSAIWSW